MKREFKLETGTLVIPDDMEFNVELEASKAVSLKRIADALDKLVTGKPRSLFKGSLFEEVFGK